MSTNDGKDEVPDEPEAHPLPKKDYITENSKIIAR
jgi:hypothetical protein